MNTNNISGKSENAWIILLNRFYGRRAGGVADRSASVEITYCVGSGPMTRSVLQRMKKSGHVTMERVRLLNWIR